MKSHSWYDIAVVSRDYDCNQHMIGIPTSRFLIHAHHTCYECVQKQKFTQLHSAHINLVPEITSASSTEAHFWFPFHSFCGTTSPSSRWSRPSCQMKPFGNCLLCRHRAHSILSPPFSVIPYSFPLAHSKHIIPVTSTTSYPFAPSSMRIEETAQFTTNITPAEY